MKNLMFLLVFFSLLGFGWLSAASESSAEPQLLNREKVMQLHDEYQNGKWTSWLEQNGEAAKKLRASGQGIEPPSLSDLSEKDVQDIQEMSGKLWNLTHDTIVKMQDICAKQTTTASTCQFVADWNDEALEEANKGRQLNNEVMQWIHSQKKGALHEGIYQLLQEYLDRSLALQTSDAEPQMGSKAIVLGYWMLDTLADVAKSHGETAMSEKVRQNKQVFGSHIAFSVEWVTVLQEVDDQPHSGSENEKKIQDAMLEHMKKAQEVMASYEEQPVSQ